MKKVYELTNDDKNFLNSREECLCYCFIDKKFFVGSKFDNNDKSIICKNDNYISWIDEGFYKPITERDLEHEYMLLDIFISDSMMNGTLNMRDFDAFTELTTLVEEYINRRN